ncbi:MAG: elongation factor P [Chlamydiales bacterium]|nr:elongation factor P [Chlamydiales bacterium]
MTTTNQISPGMVLNIAGKLYRVESSVRVTVPKGTPFIKTKLKDMASGKVSERNFKLNQAITDVALEERSLEFLYLEGKNYLFLDLSNLEQVLVPPDVVSNNAQYLKEGVQLKASFYGETVFTVELPQFLEIMVTKTEGGEGGAAGSKTAILETGARIDVPPFVESGDIIKVDTKTDEYIQRV